MAQLASNWYAALDEARGRGEVPRGKTTIAEVYALACLALPRKDEKQQVMASLQSVRLLVSRSTIVKSCAKYFDVGLVLGLFSRALNLDDLYKTHKEFLFDANSDDVLGVVSMVFLKIEQLLPAANWPAQEKGVFFANTAAILLRSYMRLSDKQVDYWYARLIQFCSWKYLVRKYSR